MRLQGLLKRPVKTSQPLPTLPVRELACMCICALVCAGMCVECVPVVCMCMRVRAHVCVCLHVYVCALVLCVCVCGCVCACVWRRGKCMCLLCPVIICWRTGGFKDHNFLVNRNIIYIFGILTSRAVDWYINELILRGPGGGGARGVQGI